MAFLYIKIIISFIPFLVVATGKEKKEIVETDSITAVMLTNIFFPWVAYEHAHTYRDPI